MLFRRSLPWLSALCVSASLAHAQTTPPRLQPPIPFPSESLEGVQLAPNGKLKRAFNVMLHNVSPLVMAFWLDPKNHPAPLGAPRSPFTYLRDDRLDGIDRIVPFESSKSLLIFGTPQAVRRLQSLIQAVDTPRSPVPTPPTMTLVPPVINQSVTFALSLYWIDSLAPEKQLLQKAVPAPRLAKEDELDLLANLMEQGRAIDSPLPTVPGVTNTVNVLPFGRPRATAILPPPGNSVDPGFSFGEKKPNVPHPIDPFNIDPDGSIDPGIQSYKPAPPVLRVPSPSRDNLTMMPVFGADGKPFMLVNGAGLQPVLLPLQGDDTILLSGAAKDWNLTPPSPRFDTFVLMVQPRIENTFHIGPAF